MKTKYKDLKELKDAIDSGEIDETKLDIVLDNEIVVGSAGGGYSDYMELYELYFPACNVESC